MSGQGQEVCLHFLNGLCRFGSDCAKAHDPSALRPLCIYFERGSCNRGASCLYAHGVDDRQPRLAPEPAGGGRGRGRGGSGRGRGRQPGRGGGARGGGRGRGRQGAAPQQRAPPPPEDPLQVYRDATEEELDMLEEWEEEEERRQAVEAYERLRRRQQGEGASAEAAAGEAEGEEEGSEEKPAPAAAAGESGKAASADGGSGGGGDSDSEAEGAEGGAAPVGSKPGASKREVPAICSQQYGKVVTPPFLDTNWCAPCRRSFTTPAGLLSHLKSAHKQDSERIAALEALRRCPCGREFEGFTPLSSHIRNVHCKPTAAQREGAAVGDALFRMAMMGGFGGGGYGSSDEDDEYGFGGGYGAFSGADVEELLCQGVKPWDDDAADVLAVLNGDFDYY